MFGISGTELIIILFFGFLIFGPDKLPQMGRTVGRAIRQFRTASEAANKKFKEEVADPFQDAIAPYKDQVEQSAKPIKDDIAAINDTLNETKNMFTDPFKDMFAPSKPEPKAAAGVAIAAGAAADGAVGTASQDNPASESVEADPTGPSGDASGTDPFADILDDVEVVTVEREAGPAVDAHAASTPAGNPKPIPEKRGSVKKSLASSLYDLDDSAEPPASATKGGE